MNLKNKNIICLALLLLFNFTMVSQTPDPQECLIILGKISNSGSKMKLKKDKGYKVELICFNTLIETETKKSNKGFRLVLKKNAIYTIKISKEGFITKIISVNTTIEEKEEAPLTRFFFETELIKEKMKTELDEEGLEFPIALISYDSLNGVFNMNEKYTQNIKQVIYSKNECKKAF